MKRVLPLLLVLALLLCACGTPAPTEAPTDPPTAPPTAPPTDPPTDPPTAPPTDPPTDPPTEPPTVPPTDPPTEPPTEPPVVYRNPLNGEVLEEPYVGRVFAVSINNVYQALPHHGISQADVFFEMFINDYCTRGLALFSNVEDVESIGSVRSTRYNFTDLAVAYNLILAHASASNSVLNDMYNMGVDEMCVDGYIGYRDSYRYDVQDYAWEHTLFVTGEALIEAAQDYEMDLAVADKDYGMLFTENGTPAGGTDASEVEIVFTLYGNTKTTVMKYDEETGKYVYWQYGEEMLDENNYEPEAFTNVIVVLADSWNDGVYHVADLYGEGEGYYACGGKIVKIKWVHEEETDPFTFFLEDGTPLQQGVGSTYVAIAPVGSPVNFE